MRHQIAITLLALAVCLVSGPAHTQPTPAVVEVITAAGLTLQPQIEWDRAILVVGGPNGERHEQRFGYPAALVFHAFDASGSPLADGLYRYELRLVPKPAGKAGATVSSGQFRIASGVLDAVSREGEAEEAPGGTPEPLVGVEDHTTEDRGTTDEICAGCSSGFEPGSESFGGEGLMIIESSSSPGLNFLKSEATSDLEDFGWEVGAFVSNGNFYVSDLNAIGTTGFLPFQIEDDTPDNTLLLTSTGRVGVGTSIPNAKLHVVGGPGGNVAIVEGGALAVQRFDGISANIRFATSGQSWLFQNQPTDGTFNIRDQTGSVTPVRIFPGGTGATLVVRNGRLGLRNTAPQHPIHAFNGARLTSGGAWANGSSREFKQDIERLSTEEALAALDELDPVKFAYKVDQTDRHVGFIAEDVPELVATSDRKALAAMDVVAVLTKVVQEQERRIEEQQTQIAELRELVLAQQAVAGGRQFDPAGASTLP